MDDLPLDDINNSELPRGALGYAFEQEQIAELEAFGEDPKVMLSRYKDSFPQFDINANLTGFIRILDQATQGACQGHALAMVFSICMFLATGRWLNFSRAAAYYLSQRKDGIRGDNGSTLSGGRWVATEHGLCLEEDWPYPSRYNPAEPPGLSFPFKLRQSKPLTTLDAVMEWIEAGLPVQIGLLWNSTCDREIVNNWQPLRASGGHSTTYWLKSPAGNVKNINSWGERWNGDGIHEWTPQSIERALRSNFTVMIGYAPDQMLFPEQKEIS